MHDFSGEVNKPHCRLCGANAGDGVKGCISIEQAVLLRSSALQTSPEAASDRDDDSDDSEEDDENEGDEEDSSEEEEDSESAKDAYYAYERLRETVFRRERLSVSERALCMLKPTLC